MLELIPFLITSAFFRVFSSSHFRISEKVYISFAFNKILPLFLYIKHIIAFLCSCVPSLRTTIMLHFLVFFLFCNIKISLFSTHTLHNDVWSSETWLLLLNLFLIIVLWILWVPYIFLLFLPCLLGLLSKWVHSSVFNSSLSPFREILNNKIRKAYRHYVVMWKVTTMKVTQWSCLIMLNWDKASTNVHISCSMFRTF